jgi:DNA-binding MarR family transcriptional regulator
MPRRTAADRESPPDTREDAARIRAADKLVSARILVLANVLRRGAGLRYRRLIQLPPGEWGVITELGRHQPRTLNELATGIGVDKTQLSRTISSLIARRLVQRKSNPRDKRELQISLTKAGEDCYATIVEAGGAANKKLLADLSVAERKQFVALIERLTERARALLRTEQKLNAMSGDRSE